MIKKPAGALVAQSVNTRYSHREGGSGSIMTGRVELFGQSLSLNNSPTYMVLSNHYGIVRSANEGLRSPIYHVAVPSYLFFIIELFNMMFTFI